jgi:hypothetical protein
MSSISKSVLCGWCGETTTARLNLQFFANGSVNFLWVCGSCKRGNPEKSKEHFIPKEKVQGYLTPAQIDGLPVLMPQMFNRCVVCGERDCELHHWAPRGRFGDDCENWPKDYLCKSCHSKWHKLVTPQLVKSYE